MKFILCRNLLWPQIKRTTLAQSQALIRQIPGQRTVWALPSLSHHCSFISSLCLLIHTCLNRAVYFCTDVFQLKMLACLRFLAPLSSFEKHTRCWILSNRWRVFMSGCRAQGFRLSRNNREVTTLGVLENGHAVVQRAGASNYRAEWRKPGRNLLWVW